MNPKLRIMTIRLMEKMAEIPDMPHGSALRGT